MRTDRPWTRLVQLLSVMTAMAVAVAAFLLPGVIGASAAVDSVGDQVLDVPPLPEDPDPLPQTSHVTAVDGSRLAELHGEVDRVPVPLEEIPEVTRDAVIATEDADFYQHQGVDHQAILRAAITNLEAGEIEQGASTLTQQYVRKVLLSPERTFERKLKEALWAIELERRLSKDEILERYLNSAYFGNGVYGIDTAARYYFSRPVSELGVAQSALLAGLIRTPEANDPIDNPEAAQRRRDIVIGQMAAEGSITPQVAQQARAQPLGLEVSEDPPHRFPFFVEWVKRIAYDPAIDLQPGVQEALGADPQERQRRLFEGGLTIHTTLDPNLTGFADGVIARYLAQPTEDPMGALVTLAPGDGSVRAMAIGPHGFGNCPEDQQDCAVTNVNPVVPGGGGSGRQPGSSFKPIAAATALDAGLTAGTEYDTPSGEAIEGCGTQGPYGPENYSGSDGGIVDLYEAAENSINVYFAKLSRDAGVPEIVEMAKRLGIRHSPNLERDFGPRSCSIGLGTANVFPLELASAYATFANDGVRCAPYAITRIEDRSGQVLYEHEPSCERVLSHEDALRLVDVLQGPPSSGGTAPYVGATLDRPVAGKTGTTTDWEDAWFMGFTPQYATAAWVGYEQPRSMFGVEAGGTYYGRVTGGTIPAHMWADYMSMALAEVPPAGFAEPGAVPQAHVPSVVGAYQDDALAAIEDAGFTAKLRVVTDHRPAGLVVSQSPSGGATAPEGSMVILAVSNGEGAPPQPEDDEPQQDEGGDEGGGQGQGQGRGQDDDEGGSGGGSDPDDGEGN